MKSSTPYILALLIISILFNESCNTKTGEMKDQDSTMVKLITLAPGHFHAALLQKSMYSNISPEVRVYAPKGQDLDAYLKLVDGYNKRDLEPTAWQEKIYSEPDFFEKMIGEKAGNVVVIAGNNQHKTDYIKRSVEAGLNVLADKPMAIDSEGFNKLVQAFEEAKKNKVLLFDIMTERYEITSILQKELTHLPEVFGELEKGTPENPAVTKESVHHYYKNVSGAPLIRPAWFFDVKQQGEGIVDITTHLVDLIQWECFPESILDFKKDISISSAKRWATKLSLPQFEEVTKLKQFPEFLLPNVEGGILNAFSNGEINYKIKDVHAKVSVTWDFKAPEGTGDTHYSVMRGTKASVIIRQGKEQDYKPVLYIEPKGEVDLAKAFQTLQAKYKGVSFKPAKVGYEVVIPEEYKVGHEAHFAQVAKKYLEYLKEGKLPEWEVSNMIAKYYTITQAREIALKSK
jgi:predicted dehydrogenase